MSLSVVLFFDLVNFLVINSMLFMFKSKYKLVCLIFVIEFKIKIFLYFISFKRENGDMVMMFGEVFEIFFMVCLIMELLNFMLYKNFELIKRYVLGLFFGMDKNRIFRFIIKFICFE